MGWIGRAGHFPRLGDVGCDGRLGLLSRGRVVSRANIVAASTARGALRPRGDAVVSEQPFARPRRCRLQRAGRLRVYR
jgi:hypothetical protein